jgi:release factor glutamine methyltransferase
VFAEDEARLLAACGRAPADLAALVARRAAGEPLEHVLGWAELRGRRVAVEPGVFVPRGRTELLAAHAIAFTRRAAARRTPVVVDLCCGSGAVGAAVAAEVPGLELHAVDIDPAAVRCARRNLPGDARVYAGDLYAPLPAALRGGVDVVVANAPYVPSGAIGLLPREARLHEPRAALDGGADGLDVVRRVIAGAPEWLASGGHVLVEASEQQAPRAAAALARRGLSPRIVRDGDLEATVVVGSSAPLDRRAA